MGTDSQNFVHHMVREQAGRTPQAVAVRCGGVSLTYGQLQDRADRLTRRLVDEGAGPERPVLLALGRSVDLAIAELAVLGAGSFYVPVHLSWPQRWIRRIAADSGASVLLTDGSLGDRVPRLPSTVRTDAPLPPAPAPAPECRPEQLAYVMYTSGSTGAPKGVAIPHAELAALVTDSMFHEPGAHERVLMLASYAFDPADYALWHPLTHGGTAVIATEDQVTADGIADLVRTERITAVEITSGLFNLVGEERPHAFAGTREVLTGGDVVSATAVRNILRACPGTTVRATYGPTETTLYATQVPLRGAAQVTAPVPLGRPLDGLRVQVLDGTLAPVRPGEVGEIYLGGAGLARCYQGRPDLTAERFVADPCGPAGSRMYRTGDRARTLPGGLLVFAGRADRQLKIRGFRVEVAEVEAVLASCRGVRQAAVAVRRGQRSDDTKLVGYPVLDGTVTPAGIQAELARRLPDYMVPAALVPMDRLPLTPNHKVDHKALPAPPDRPAAPAVAPRTAHEAGLCALFADVLGTGEPGIDDDFFQLGGDSLSATRLVGRIRAEYDIALTVGAVFGNPTVAQLAGLLTDTAEGRPALLRTDPRPAVVPLSPVQQRLWFLSCLDATSAAYNLPVLVRIKGAVDVKALTAALRDLLGRHESLRTVVRKSTDGPCQVVLPAAEATPELVAESVADLDRAVREEARRPFDPATDPPLRARLFEAGDGDSALLLVLNHIGTDGWSLGPLTRDLEQAYGARRQGHAPSWPPLPVQYADYTLWHQRLLGDPRDPGSLAAHQLAHWRRTLDGVPGELQLPADRSRPAAPAGRGGAVPLQIDAALHAEVRHIARATGTTVFMVLHAALAALLTRLGAGTDIPVGTTVAGRTEAVLDDLVGFFVNTLVLRTDTAGRPSFRQLLGRVRETDLAAFEHQDVPFDLVVDAHGAERSPARHPLFQVMLALETPGGYRFTLPGLQTDTEELHNDTAKCDLLLSLTEQQGPESAPAGITGRLEYDAGLFDAGTADLIARRFTLLLAAAVHAPEQEIEDLDLFLPGERHRTMVRWNATDTPLPRSSLSELLRRQASRTPTAIAVAAHDGRLSYAELDHRSDRLAQLLLARGAGPGTSVALLLPRGMDLVVAFAAVLKAGAAYLPVDVGHPDDRIRYILEDARPAVVLGREEPAGRLAGDVPLLDPAAADRPDGSISPQEPAAAGLRARTLPDAPGYVVYTSGSTGRPKGVVLPARVLHNLLAWNASVFPGEPGSRVAQFSAVGFDASEHEMLTALLNGKTLCVPDEDTRLNPAKLAAWLERERITEFFAPDLVISAVLEAAAEQGLRLAHLRHILQAGEPLRLTPRLAAFHRARPLLRLHNHYGPSETHVVTAATLPADVDAWPAGAPLGDPIWNTRGYVLDTRLRPVPVGVEGELYLAGECLAHGYLGRPGLTAGRFVADPFGGPGERLYRTGDLVIRRPDGSLEFRGRTDDQLKIRGIRIEPGEIEGVLAAHSGVGQAAVVPQEDEALGPHLVAYVVPAEGAAAPASEELRRCVARALPEAMVPAAFVLLPALPLTPNGKLDRRSLPRPDRRGGAGREPSTAHERLLCRLFAEVLGVATVGVRDDFFELGGSSLLATRLVNRIGTKLSLDMPVRWIFESPTVAGLAGRLEAEPSHGEASRAPRRPALVRRTPPGAAPASPASSPFRGPRPARRED
ncbi:amino acid adenylation domain-containing protein [Streptomyces sp. NPDC088801]|uniref:amino acid adenylation domain-containing protein n=1 Tax=Streptomyces sp. NPDC088801 TaxID=3365903 RepID=UPI00382D32D9